jgi:hypothetical protein
VKSVIHLPTEVVHPELWLSRRLKPINVIDVISDSFILRSVPEHIRSDSGPKFLAGAAQMWIAAVRARIAHVTPGSLCYCGFNVRLNT